MLLTEFIKTLVLSLLNIYFLTHVLGYTPETNLGKCFEGTSQGYILLFDRSFVDCVRECKRRPRCQSVRYDRRVLICMLYPTDQIPKRDIGQCYQASRRDFIHRYALEGKCEEYYTRCKETETCSLNSTTMEPFCEILDCADRPSSSLPHTEMLHYVDSQVGAKAKLQCKSYVEFSDGWSSAVCTEQGNWNTTIHCKVPQDCTELYDKYNVRKSGPHYISPDNRIVVRAFCEMTKEGGWTIIQKRMNSSVNFTRNWEEYKAGFGEATGNYWIGNDALHALTTSNNTLRIQLTHFDGSNKSAEYINFRVSSESAKYKMTYAKYVQQSSAVDALGNTLPAQFQAKDMPFSTIDRDNDRLGNNGCADTMRGGWWYNKCSTSNLNGIHCNRGQSCMTWQTTDDSILHGHKETAIMIQRTYSSGQSMLTEHPVHDAL